MLEGRKGGGGEEKGKIFFFLFLSHNFPLAEDSIYFFLFQSHFPGGYLHTEVSYVSDILICIKIVFLYFVFHSLCLLITFLRLSSSRTFCFLYIHFLCVC